MTALDEPVVSVIMPVFDAERFLEATLDSVFAQTYATIEVVLADGGSTDRTLSIAQRYSLDHPGKVRMIEGDPGSGPCHRRNQAIDASSGSLLCWLDSDDLWEPTKVEQQVAIMQARPEVGLVYARFEAFDSDTGEVLWTNHRGLEIEGDILAPLFVYGCYVGALTTMYRRSVLADRGLRLRERDFAFGDDYALWLALALDWQAAFIPEVLARYRRHAGNESDRIVERTNPYEGLVGIQREFLQAFPEARQRLGSERRRGLAFNYWQSYELEAKRGRLGRAARAWIRGCVLAPRLFGSNTLQSLRGSVVEKVRRFRRRPGDSAHLPPTSPPR